MSLYLFTNGWEFRKFSVDASYSDVLKVWNEPWRKVDLPHDFLIENVKDLYENASGWYRRTFFWDLSSHGQDRCAIRFDGVYMDSAVYVNGHLLGEWKYGYSTFEFDMTPLLTDGVNTILVRATHQSPNSRWYSGAGIYRKVSLRITPRVFLAADGICYGARKTDGSDDFTVEYSAEVELPGGGEGSFSLEDLHLRITIREKKSKTVAARTRIDTGEIMTENTISEGNADISCKKKIFRETIKVQAPHLWSPDDPFLYVLRTELYLGDALLDSSEGNLGFRTILVTTDGGLFLNGKSMKIKGVCEHHDLGALGAAFDRSAMARKMRILKSMGVNALRTAHNMPAPEVMDLADEMGFLVDSEAFDMWIRPKTEYDYARFFPTWWKKDVASWVRRDRNHPSLLFWSIGNEIYDMHADPGAPDLTEEMAREVRRHDLFGQGLVTFGSNYMAGDGAKRCADRLKVVGYNYGERLYKDHHEKYPDWCIYGSETASLVSSRGIYHFPLSESVLSDDDLQCSALGNSATSWGAKNAEYTLTMERDHPFSLGQFLWSGFDYLGEPTPYHTKNSYLGQIDTAGFRKDSFYLYQAGWTDGKKAPFVHVFPYWDFNEGQMIDVRVVSNLAAVELFVNGVSCGVTRIDREHGASFGGNYRIPYEPGEIVAVAYDENGKEAARQSRHSFKDAAALVMEAEDDGAFGTGSSLCYDGNSLIFLDISAIDRDGYPVENADNRVHISVSGPGRLIGLDNGDSTDPEEYKTSSRRLFSGKLLAIISPNGGDGTICVHASSRGLKSAEVRISVKVREEELPEYYDDAPLVHEMLCGGGPGASPAEKNQSMPEGSGADLSFDPIPVRKIGLSPVSEGKEEYGKGKTLTIFSPGHTSQIFEAVIFPKDASYSDLKWRVITDGGAELNLATVVPLDLHGRRALVEAKGDGDFRIRVTANNDRDHVEVMSHLECHVTGLGTAYTDPYEFVTGSTYGQSSGNIGNGNERGFATAAGAVSYAAFPNLDFGPVGSDEVTIPIFELGSNPVEPEFYDGIPGEGGELLGIGHYHKRSIWNTYQPETFRLNRKMKGIRTFSILMRGTKIHVKGFSFTKRLKAYEVLTPADADAIYGDTFTRKEDALIGIGNNVSVVYEGMVFPSGLSRITICARAPKSANTIHLLFSDGETEVRKTLEFPLTEEFESREFVIEGMESLIGQQHLITVTWIFLPGSCFDLKWFRFEG